MTAGPIQQRTVCIAENRDGAEAGIRLAIASLARLCPELAVNVFAPRLTAAFDTWATKFPLVARRPEDVWEAMEWNCKPAALQMLLAAGYEEVIWLDSDVLVSRPLGDLLGSLSPQTILVAQEAASQPFQGTELRTRGWNMPVGRSLPMTVNSAIVRVTHDHLPLLEAWHRILTSASYQEIQKRPMEQRPIHALGDQDVLNALLGSAEFANLPLRILRTGSEIIHSGGALGYGVRERLSGLTGGSPYLLHAIAGKPWVVLGPQYRHYSPSRWFVFYRRLLQEVSPYVMEAIRYESAVGLDCPWLRYRTILGTCLRWLSFHQACMAGLPISLAAACLRAVHVTLARMRLAPTG